MLINSLHSHPYLQHQQAPYTFLMRLLYILQLNIRRRAQFFIPVNRRIENLPSKFLQLGFSSY